uniref:Uncharacterized protein LOC114334998 n=1 Tax=Diabrotica virgifera virgifera TaxID=50390 RepID=A0A6P7FWP1_DIAVI
MCDALQELSDVSEELQHRDLDLFRANKKLQILMNTFVSRKGSPGMFYAQAKTAVNNRSFMGIELYVKSKEDPINAVVFYDHLAQSIEKRMLSGDDAVLANCARIVDKSVWPKNVKDNTFGERDIEVLAVRLQVNKREAIKSFRL